jgi:hypothetical protein
MTTWMLFLQNSEVEIEPMGIDSSELKFSPEDLSLR